MPRKLRIQHAFAMYHVTNSKDQRADICKDDGRASQQAEAWQTLNVSPKV
jgi:hypothetical protein